MGKLSNLILILLPLNLYTIKLKGPVMLNLVQIRDKIGISTFVSIAGPV